jgi:hypothetical protein
MYRPACTVTIEVQAEFTTDLGPEPVSSTRASPGVLPNPCPVCGLPVAAIFADTGRHLLCGSLRWRR